MLHYTVTHEKTHQIVEIATFKLCGHNQKDTSNAKATNIHASGGKYRLMEMYRNVEIGR